MGEISFTNLGRFHLFFQYVNPNFHLRIYKNVNDFFIFLFLFYG